ncbi:hypothetical protein BSF_35530 [Bacillus subtilis]|nr:hypothetical protein BSF_35530 [Bacillus subtilis]
MYIFQAEELSAKETYKLLSGAVIPRPIAFVTTLSSGGAINAAPFSFYNVVKILRYSVFLLTDQKAGKKIQPETR